jgi:hypothetical protein
MINGTSEGYSFPIFSNVLPAKSPENPVCFQLVTYLPPDIRIQVMIQPVLDKP